MDDTRKVFGIDLGTTYSCVAQVNEFDQAIVLKNFENQSTTPSVVYFGDNNKVIVGTEAKEMSKIEPERTVAFVKRSISEDSAYDKPANFPNGLDPTEISSLILKKIVNDANAAAQNPEPVKKVVITCPAYFGTKERMRTKQAGEAAGLEVLAIINEPTAAAIAYGMKVQAEKNILVYDLGGGTFDVTIIRVNGGTITVIATGGDLNLGGKDWDTAFAEYLLAQYNKETGNSYKWGGDKQIENELLIAAEEKKQSLTGRDSVNVVLSIKGKTARIPVSRNVFDKLTEAKLDETVDKTREVIEKAKEKGVSIIDEVLLVGGSSKMPQVKERVDREFNCNAKLTDPDECVAKGAAIFALNESFSQAMEEYAEGERDEKPIGISLATKTRVINVTSKNYGIECFCSVKKRFIVQNIIFANMSLDGNCRGETTFSTLHENQSEIIFPVYESDVAEDEIETNEGVKLEEHTLKLTKLWPKGKEIKVVCEVDTEGILHIHVEVDRDILDFNLKLTGVKSEEELEKSKALVESAKIE